MPRNQPSDLDAEGALRHIQAQARYFFAPEEFAALTGRTGKSAEGFAVKRALARLSQRGRIVLATKRPAGWLIVPAEHEHYGAPPVEWWLDDCARQLDPGYYVGLLSAARHWGSSHYALQSTQVMLGRRHLPLKIGRLQVDFVAKTHLDRTPVVVVRGDVSSWRVSTREATLLDLVRHQATVGGIEAPARTAKDFSRVIVAAALRQALDALDQVAAAQRLGFLFDHLGMKKPAAVVANWLSPRRALPQPLVLQDDNAGEEEEIMNNHWNIRYRPRHLGALEALR